MKTIAIIVAASMCAGNFISHYLWGTSFETIAERSFFQSVAIFAHTIAIHFACAATRKTD